MVCHGVFNAFLVADFQVELLQEKNPPDQSRFCIFLTQEVFDRGMICVDNDLRPDQVRSELVESEHNCK